MGISIPVGGFALIGYSIGILGAWTAMLLWGITCVIALLQNFIFAELAAMFPDKPGGIALYAHEGWRRYFSPVGALAAVGYWAGWSFGLAVYGLIIGQLLAGQFFPSAKWTFFDGAQHIGLAVILGALAVVAVWALNIFGVRPAVRSNKIIGPASAVVTIILCGALFLNMTAATADAGRALYGISRDAMIVKQLFKLNRHGMPGRAMTIDLVVNVCLVLFVANILGILFASNLGYMIAVAFALSGFLLLRRDRPAWPRPIRRGSAWIGVAWGLLAFNLVLIVVGALDPGIAGYGGTTDQLIGLGILAASILMFLFRRLVQDRVPLQLREPTPAVPSMVGVVAEPAYVGAGEIVAFEAPPAVRSE